MAHASPGLLRISPHPHATLETRNDDHRHVGMSKLKEQENQDATNTYQSDRNTASGAMAASQRRTGCGAGRRLRRLNSVRTTSETASSTGRAHPRRGWRHPVRYTAAAATSCTMRSQRRLRHSATLAASEQRWRARCEHRPCDRIATPSAGRSPKVGGGRQTPACTPPGVDLRHSVRPGLTLEVRRKSCASH